MDKKIPILEIQNLNVSIKNTQILKNLNLIINKGEIHAIMGRNGSGKSTLSKVIAGHPGYKILSGDILFHGQSILEIAPEVRSHMGIFLAFQYPVEIPGVSNEDFLRLAYNSKRQYEGHEEINPIDFLNLLNDNLKIVQMNSTFLTRNVNEGFSGGEKKKNEVLQMSLLNSHLSILDETDSGLDIDALRIISKGILHNLKDKDKSIILITHYQRLLDYVKPDYIHIMHEGSIVETGDSTLAKKLELTGYDWLSNRKKNSV